MGLVPLQQVESPQTRGRTCAPALVGRFLPPGPPGQPMEALRESLCLLAGFMSPSLCCIPSPVLAQPLSVQWGVGSVCGWGGAAHALSSPGPPGPAPSQFSGGVGFVWVGGVAHALSSPGLLGAAPLPETAPILCLPTHQTDSAALLVSASL